MLIDEKIHGKDFSNPLIDRPQNSLPHSSSAKNEEKEMRRKKHRHLIHALLLLILIVFTLPSIGVRPAMSYECSVSRYTTEGWPEDWNEEEYWPDEIDVAQDVTYYVATKYYALSYEWVVYNPHYLVSASGIYSLADSMDDYDYVTAWQYMHGSTYNEQGLIVYLPFPWYQYPVNVEHYYAFIEGDDIYDNQLYQYTGNGHHYFVFLWTCASAKQIGYYDSSKDLGNGWYYFGTGAVGWPYAWTHQDENDLSDDGYNDPDETDYCVIGFETFSPPLSNVTGYQSKTMSDFVEAFYDKALQTSNRKTINQALDYASQQAFGESYFDDTILYGDGWNAWVPPPVGEYWHTSMRVFGNGDNYVSIG